MDESIDVDVHPLAMIEIDEADDWYANVDQQVADDFLEAVYTALKNIDDHPRAFPVVKPPLRRCMLRGFPYVILFDNSHPRVRVIAVAHTRRRPGYWHDRIDRSE